MLSLLDASRDEATGTTLKDNAGMDNKKGWEVLGCLYLSKDNGIREMVFRQW